MVAGTIQVASQAARLSKGTALDGGQRNIARHRNIFNLNPGLSFEGQLLLAPERLQSRVYFDFFAYLE